MLKIEELREIIELIDESSIDEFSYEIEGAKIKLKKQSETREVVQVQKAVEPVGQGQIDIPNPQATENMATQNNDTKDQPEPVSDSHSTIDFDYEIVSPMVGTLYSAPSPGKEPSISIGSSVTKDSVVC